MEGRGEEGQGRKREKGREEGGEGMIRNDRPSPPPENPRSATENVLWRHGRQTVRLPLASHILVNNLVETPVQSRLKKDGSQINENIPLVLRPFTLFKFMLVILAKEHALYLFLSVATLQKVYTR
jgi:hypothetical protein